MVAPEDQNTVLHISHPSDGLRDPCLDWGEKGR